MSGCGRRPPRPGMVPGGGMGQGWVLGVNMPPLGYGLVAQQPHMAAPQPHMAAPQPHMAPHQPLMAPQQAWQQQQQQHFMAQQAGLAGAPMGVATLTQQQQQQQQQQFPQHLQQQWMEAQRRAAEEQRKYYDQMMKQRQFDEQKMRLKAFSASKKTGVSADTMIESILGGKEAPKQRSPQPVKKGGGGAEEQGAHTAATTTSQAQTPRQGTAVDWKKMENVNSLFASPKKTITPVTTTTSTTEHPIHPAQDTTSNTPLPAPTVAPNNITQQAPAQPAPPITMGDVAGGRKEGKSPVILPQWLKDSSAVPEVYKRAVGLVARAEGWVDTSRAYMLLMKTGLPPPLLGVLWEMVNCTAPGQLTQEEFVALLALVAVVQSGQPITGPDVLAATTEPLLPLMDHPALAPLVQDYLQTKKQQAENNTPQTNDDDEFDDFVSVTVTSTTAPPQASVVSQGFTQTAQAAPQPAGTSAWPQVTAAEAQKPDVPQIDKNKAMNLPKLGLSPELSPTVSFDDDFDDFQSASLPGVSQVNAGSGTSTTTTTTTATATITTSTPAAAPSVLQPEKPGVAEDKYAVFREITGLSVQETVNEGENADDSFGEFCSSEVASLSLAQSTSSTLPSLLQCQSASGTSNTSPISFEVYSTPPEALPDTQTFEADFSSAFAPKQPDNYADIHEAMKRAEEEQKRKEENRWSDPFGEFEEATPPSISAPPAPASNGSGGSLPPPSLPPALSVPWLKVGSGGEEEEEEEDFGDFMGPTEGGGGLGGLGGGSQSLPPHLENLGETQSVASLELPGLEMTVGVETSDTLGLGSNHSPDLFLQPRSDVGCLDDQFGGLSLDSSAPPPAGGVKGSSGGGGGGMNNNSNSSSLAPQHSTTGPAGSVIDSYCSTGGLVDKYSIIREEASRDTQPPGEAHTGSWERCLEGSVKLLEEAHGILSSLALPASLKTQVLATTQMQDYLANVQEVWLVCGRIGSSSRRVTTSTRVDELLSQARSLWEDILAGAENAIVKQPETDSSSDENDNHMGEGEVCGVCLTGGGSRLTYGGHSYHPPCANLWLNCVDLLLPSLTPVTLL
ncbi:synergin gamma-like isoform X3 [Portunus trituberculatus]|uniref:synergin gamma-like isoform X3 n=1 Tax=Portunus trituberculatus TaxID=210409 RepID=UPI001E1CDBDA|nr:synergin gamma-like isoform X3 [Portunus trituberculatus]